MQELLTSGNIAFLIRIFTSEWYRIIYKSVRLTFYLRQ